MRLSDQRQVNVIFTTGETGFSERDRTPEATIAVCDRMANGIAEAIRNYSMTITPRAMFIVLYQESAKEHWLLTFRAVRKQYGKVWNILSMHWHTGLKSWAVKHVIVHANRNMNTFGRIQICEEEYAISGMLHILQ